MKQYIATAVARPGKFLPGGAKKWQSGRRATRQEASDLLDAYLDGYGDSVEFTSIREIETGKPIKTAIQQSQDDMIALRLKWLDGELTKQRHH